MGARHGTCNCVPVFQCSSVPVAAMIQCSSCCNVPVFQCSSQVFGQVTAGSQVPLLQCHSRLVTTALTSVGWLAEAMFLCCTVAAWLRHFAALPSVFPCSISQHALGFAAGVPVFRCSSQVPAISCSAHAPMSRCSMFITQATLSCTRQRPHVHHVTVFHASHSSWLSQQRWRRRCSSVSCRRLRSAADPCPHPMCQCHRAAQPSPTH